MKKRILAIISLILCVTSLLSCVGCTMVEDEGDYSESSTNSGSDSLYSESPTEKKTEKKTEKRTEKKTTAKETEPALIPGVSKAEKALTKYACLFTGSPVNSYDYKLQSRAKPSSNGLIFDNSCATLEFQGYMTGDVNLTISTHGGAYGFAHFTVYVDGKRVNERFYVKGSKQKITIASFTGDYYHTIKVVKQTEFKWSLATINRLEITGYLIAPPKDNDYYIEFLGDSLTTAYGNIGKPGYEPDDSPEFQDGTQSYAYILADAIGADYSMISRSAAGLSQCWSNSPILDYYKKHSKDRSSEDFDIANARKPDLIVLHLGANDYNVGGSNESNFIAKGKELINYFRENYGEDVPIIWAYDPNEGFPDKVKEIMNSFGGESAGYYTLSLPWSEAGAGGHPSYREHEKHASLLLNLITSKNILK